MPKINRNQLTRKVTPFVLKLTKFPVPDFFIVLWPSLKYISLCLRPFLSLPLYLSPSLIFSLSLSCIKRQRAPGIANITISQQMGYFRFWPNLRSNKVRSLFPHNCNAIYNLWVGVTVCVVWRHTITHYVIYSLWEETHIGFSRNFEIFVKLRTSVCIARLRSQRARPTSVCLLPLSLYYCSGASRTYYYL